MNAVVTERHDKVRWKDSRPKDVRGVLNPDVRENDARRENAAIRKRMVRRQRRLEKQEWRRTLEDKV